MTKNVGPVFSAVIEFTGGNFRNRIFVGADIPAKKLVNAQSKYITRNDPIIALIDDTLFGSAKDGLAISENYIYAKDLLGDGKSVKISSIRSVSSQSNKLGSLDIYFGGNLFATLSTIDKEDHDFVIGILKAAFSASKSVVNSAPAKVKKQSKPVAAEPKPKNSISLKETVACSECSANLPASAKFCLECGTKVLPKGVCLECNAKLPEKAKFCSECGTPAGKVPAKPVQPKVDTQAPIASIRITAAPADGVGQGATVSSEGTVSGEIVDWDQAADRAFNFFFNAIRKGEDTDTAAEWFRGEIADQTEAAGIVYDYGWEQEITPSQLQLISNTVANRLKGLNDEQGYQVSSDFYHGFIASFSNIIYNRSQEGNGDFEDLQKYWDQTIGNELPEECGTSLAYPTDFEIGEDVTSNDEKNERSSRSIRVRNVTVGILTGEGSFTGYVGFDDIDEMSSLMIFLDDDETPLGYSIKTHDKSLAVNNCDGGNVDDFFLRDQLPEALKDKWNLVLLASIDIDEAEDEGVEHYVYFPDEEAESSSPFNIESDFSNFSQVGRFLAVHQVMGWFEWNSDVELQLPLDKFLRGEIADGLLLSIDNIGFISDYETESEQLCLIHY